MKINTNKLELLLANNAMSTNELAELSKVNIATICRLRRGTQEGRPQTVGKIAKALGVDVKEIIE